MTAEQKNESAIVYFDGVCNLCNGFVDFLIRRDKKRRLRYTSLQSVRGQEVVADRRLWGKTDESVLFLDDGRLYDASTAAIRIVSRLGGVYRIVGVFYVVPRAFRDELYQIVAERRYRWFGKRDKCRVPTAEERELFIDK